MEANRLHFSWISSAEAGKFVEVVNEITERVRQLGPAKKLVKGLPVFDQDAAASRQVAFGRGE